VKFDRDVGPVEQVWRSLKYSGGVTRLETYEKVLEEEETECESQPT
jgi:hypothetical protein